MSGLWQDLVGRGGKLEMFALLWCVSQLRLFCALVRLVGTHYPAKVNDGGTLVWHGDSTISAMRSLLLQENLQHVSVPLKAYFSVHGELGLMGEKVTSIADH